MKSNLLILSLMLAVALNVVGCTSKKASDSAETDVAAEASGEDLAGGDDLAVSSEASGGDTALGSDEQIAEGGGEASSEVATDEFALEGEGSGGDFATPAEELSQSVDNSADQSAQEPSGDTITPEPLIAEDNSSGLGSEPPIEEPVPKSSGPLRKMATEPWTQNGVVVNGLYVARKGDTLESITQKIYSSNDRMSEIAQINPTFKSRDVKAGDKIYYNSPSRPTDNTVMKLYYEEIGLNPETYVVNQPENIREVAKKLFGAENSWKELWATNLDVESKGELPSGTQLRYWSGTSEAPLGEMPVAASETPSEPAQPDAAMNEPPVEQPPMEQPPMEPPPYEPVAQVPPPPPPPPPPPADMTPPPSQADAGTTASVGGEGLIPGVDLENPDQMMFLGAGAILLFAALALFVIIRKRKTRRQLDFHTSTQTQIE